MGKVLEAPAGPSINPLFSGSKESQDKFLERYSDGQGASRELKTNFYLPTSMEVF